MSSSPVIWLDLLFYIPLNINRISLPSDRDELCRHDLNHESTANVVSFIAANLNQCWYPASDVQA